MNRKNAFFAGVVISSLFCLTLIARAGGREVGNGGDAVVCTDGAGFPNSATQLDLFEGIRLRGFTPDMGDVKVPYQDKVQEVIARVTARDSIFGRFLRDGWAEFQKDSQLVDGASLVLIPDANSLLEPPAGCKIQQVAIHQPKEFSLDKAFFIDASIWNLMDNDSKAELVLHEIIYAKAHERGAQNSVASRYLVSLIATKKMNDLTAQDYLTTIREVNVLDVANVGGSEVYVTLHAEDYKPNETGRWCARGTLQVAGHAFQVPEPTGRDYECYEVSFFPNGRLQKLSQKNLAYYGPSLAIAPFNEKLIRFRDIELYESGVVKSALGAQDSVTFDNGGEAATISVTSGGYDNNLLATFDEKGVLTSIDLASSGQSVVVKTNGIPVSVWIGSTKGFNVNYCTDKMLLDAKGLIDLSQYDAYTRTCFEHQMKTN